MFVGIDAPEFNLRLARDLRAAGIPTVQYVSPQVWAWRQGRARSIRESVDLVLCLLPFEKRFYDEHGMRAEFVGHPLADAIPHDGRPRKPRGALSASTPTRRSWPCCRGAGAARWCGWRRNSPRPRAGSPRSARA